MSFTYEHAPYAVHADDHQPLFFRRRYGGDSEPQEKVMVHGRPMTVISLAPAEPIYIYGYSFSSEYPEDRYQQDVAWQQTRSFLAFCHSVMCPEGEPGFVPFDQVEAISKEDFEAAAAKEWEG